jgi:hypothetical protein
MSQHTYFPNYGRIINWNILKIILVENKGTNLKNLLCCWVLYVSLSLPPWNPHMSNLIVKVGGRWCKTRSCAWWTKSPSWSPCRSSHWWHWGTTEDNTIKTMADTMHNDYLGLVRVAGRWGIRYCVWRPPSRRPQRRWRCQSSSTGARPAIAFRLPTILQQ